MVVLDRHIATCARCRFRLARERDLRSHERLEDPGSIPGDAPLYTWMPSPMGTLWLAGGSDGLLDVAYAVDEASFCWEVERRIGQAPWYVADALAEERRQIRGYLDGTLQQFTLDLDLRGFTAFQRIVFQAVREIPYGETRAYGEVAADLGRLGAGRAVGTAVAHCSLSFLVPCHRVVRSGGTPGTYAPRTLGPCGAIYQTALIEHERRSIGERRSIQ